MDDATAPAKLPFSPFEPPDDAPTHVPRLLPEAPLPPYLLGGTINLLIGSHGSGKTSLLRYILERWMRGEPVFGVPPTDPAQAHGFLSTSRSYRQNIYPLMHDLPRPLKTYCLLDDAGFDLTHFRKKTARVEILELCLNHLALPRGGVVWVDPFTLFLGGNLLDFDACATSCLEIHKVLATRGLTLVGTGMTAKPKAEGQELYPRLLDRIVGTVSQLAFVDTAMYLATPDELKKAQVYTLQIHAQHAPPTDVELVRDALGRFRDAPPDAEYAPILNLIPPDGEVSLAVLRKALVPRSMSRPTLFRAVKVLVEEGRLVKVAYGTYRRAATH